jgi:hypothetical protein
VRALQVAAVGPDTLKCFKVSITLDAAILVNWHQVSPSALFDFPILASGTDDSLSLRFSETSHDDDIHVLTPNLGKT